MDALHAFLLAVIQGLTEFLPISSSAHLVLLPIIMQWQDQGVVIDIAAHLGSLLAVVFYFRHDLSKLVISWLRSFGVEHKSDNARLAWNIFWATIPIFIVALFVQAYLLVYARNAVVIGIASIVFALLLWLADKRGSQKRTNKELNVKDALLIGFAQTFALVPGASRSGVTMTAGMWVGLTRVEAARFSFLLAIPTILAASVYGAYKGMIQEASIDWALTIGVTACSAIVAFLCIDWFLKVVTKLGMMPFVIYRIVLGIVLLFFYL